MNINAWEFLIISIIIVCSLVAYYFNQNALLLLIIALLLFTHQYQLNKISALLQHKKTGTSFIYGLTKNIYEQISYYQRHWLKYRESKRRIFRRFQLAFKHFPEAILLLDSQWLIRWANPKCEELFSIGKIHYYQNLSALIPHPVLTEYLEEKDFTKALEIELPQNKQIIIALQFVTLSNHEFILIIRDITKQTILSRRNKDFIANATHELKTPLTVIKGFAEPMKADLEQFEPHWQTAINSIYQQTDKMQQLVNELLTLSKLESIAPDEQKNQEIDMDQLLNNAINDALLMTAKTGHQIKASLDKKLKIHADPQFIRLIINNLLNNAIQHTPERSHIEIEWNKCETDACLVVRDNGEGIAVRHLARLTERFYRVESSRNRNKGGTGLGLAIVRHALERSHGKLEINSEVGFGTTFVCRFELND